MGAGARAVLRAAVPLGLPPQGVKAVGSLSEGSGGFGGGSAIGFPPVFDLQDAERAVGLGSETDAIVADAEPKLGGSLTGALRAFAARAISSQEV
jgi:hypothetical protein